MPGLTPAIPRYFALETNGVDEYLGSATAHARHVATGYTVGQWRYLPSGAAAGRALWAVCNSSTNADSARVHVSNTGEFVWTNQSSAPSGTANDTTAAGFVPTDEWFRVIFSVSKSGGNFSVVVQCTDAGAINTDTLTGVWHSPVSLNLFSLSNLPRLTPASWSNGYMGCCVYWDSVLTASQMTAWIKSYDPFLFSPVGRYPVDRPGYHGGVAAADGDAPDVGLGTTYDLTGTNMTAANVVLSEQVVAVP